MMPCSAAQSSVAGGACCGPQECIRQDAANLGLLLGRLVAVPYLRLKRHHLLLHAPQVHL